MKIIEGRVGKSRYLEREIVRLDIKRSLYIESVRVNSLLLHGMTMMRTTNDKLVYLLDALKDSNDNFLGQYDNIVFGINGSPKIIGTLLDYERDLNKNFIVTIQNDDMEEVSVYETTNATY